MRWYKAGNIFLAVLAVILGVSAVITRPHTASADAESAHWRMAPEGLQYLDDSGEPVRNSWQEIYGAERFFDGRGILVSEGWLDVMGQRFYLNGRGEKTVGWLQQGDGRYYFESDGSMATAFCRIDGKRYYMGEDGRLMSGWIEVDGYRYLLSDSGEVQTGWLEKDGAVYYLDGGGRMARGLQQIDGAGYYFDDSGLRETGWVSLGSVKYYFESDGRMHTGWLDTDAGRYYMDKNGIMRTGWVTMDGKSLYFDKNGLYDPSAKPGDSVTKTGPMVALTFDDGPGKYTDRLLNCLEENHVKATFFMLGTNVGRYPDAVKRMKEMGCEIGNHTTNHKKLTSLAPEEVRLEISETDQKLTDLLGSGASLMRPPYGAYDDMVKQNSPYPLILWSIDTLDWKTLNAQSTVDTILEQVKDGDIILMHDIHSTSVDAAEIVIPELIRRGYQLVTVSELAAANGKTLAAGSAYGSIRP